MTLLASPAPTLTLVACLDELADVDVDAMSGTEQAELLQVIGMARAKLESVRLRLLAAADRSGTARKSGAADTGQWAASVCRQDQPAAHRAVALARGLERRTLTASALAKGEISAEHAEVIVRADRRLPQGLSHEQRTTVEADLVSRAKSLPPHQLRRAARRALAAVESDRSVVDAHENAVVAGEEEVAWTRTRLSLHDNADGTVSGSFTVPTLHGHLLRKILDTMTAPRRGRLGATSAQVGDQSDRTDWDRARGLAFCEVIEHLPTDRLHTKTAATIVVTIDEAQLRGRLEAAGLDTGESISAGEARRLACNAGMLPAVLGGGSLPLDLGRLKRLFSEAQRIALGLLFRTCAADGCERPYAWCELHHRHPWSHGGRTDLAGAAPLCHFHHQRVHDDSFTHRWAEGGRVTFHRRT
jgi:hypothetical protein